MVAGIGSAGAATFAMDVEGGATVTYEWLTDVLKSMSGLEQRVSLLTKPRQRFAFTSRMDDSTQRRVLSALAANAPQAPVFLLGIAYEALPVAGATSTTLTTYGLSLCDWAEPGQRIVVTNQSGDIGEAVVQSVSGDDIEVDADLTSVAVPGSLVMPAMGIYLDSRQALSRYQLALSEWELTGIAERFRYGAAGEAGKGATVTTYDGMPVWDRGVPVESLVEQPLYSGADLVDLGARVSALQSYSHADWGRRFGIVDHRRSEWQWFKRFLDTVRGRWKAFLLPTGRPDLVPLSDASTGTLTIDASDIDYSADWYPSLAHRRIRIVLDDGTSEYRIVASVDDHGATQDLVLDSPLVGAIERVEFLETVRLESDEVQVTWEGRVFRADLSARVVQR